MDTIELLRKIEIGEDDEDDTSVNESTSSDETSDRKSVPEDDDLGTQKNGETSPWKFWGMISTVGAFFGNNDGKTSGEEYGRLGSQDEGGSRTLQGRTSEKKAVVANLGSESKFIYDKEKKMWVNSFSGKNAAPISPRTPRRNNRPNPIDLPPTDDQLGPT